MFEKEADLIHDLNKIKSISNIVLPFLVILFITSITSITYFLMSKNKKKIASRRGRKEEAKMSERNSRRTI